MRSWLGMDQLEPQLHAFCTPTPDLARAEARRIEQAIMRGDATGPLAGVPVSIKDLIFTKGIRTVSGCVAYRDFVPDEDDIVVERLKAADAIILGKTNVSELGYSAASHNPVFETTRNPMGPRAYFAADRARAQRWRPRLEWARSRSAATVVARSGFPRRFAAPTVSNHHSAVSRSIRARAMTLSRRFGMGIDRILRPAHAHRARQRADAVSITGPDMRDRHSLPRADFEWLNSCEGGLRGKRVAFSPDWGYMAVDPEVADIVAKAARVFERDLGCIVEETNPGWENPAAALPR